MCGETPQIGSARSESSDAPQRSGGDRAEPGSAGACSNPRAAGLPLLSPPRRPLPHTLPCARRRSCRTPIPAHACVARAQSYTRSVNPKRHHKQNNSYTLAETRCSPRVSSAFRRRALAHTGEPFPEGCLKTLFHITETFPDRDPVPQKSVLRCRHTSSLPMRAGTELPRRPASSPSPKSPPRTRCLHTGVAVPHTAAAHASPLDTRPYTRTRSRHSQASPSVHALLQTYTHALVC